MDMTMRLPNSYGGAGGGVGQPQGVSMPQGVPMQQGSAPYGSPAPAPTAAAPSPAFAGAGASVGGGPTSMGMPSPRPPQQVGQNGFGIHPEASIDEIANHLLPSFKNVESSGDYTNYIGKTAGKSQDPSKTASGAYGYINRTWNNHGGYPRAMDAPPEVQDARMKQDLTGSLNRFGGDPFKAVANHYYPKYASDPTKWNDPLKDSYGKEIPGSSSVADYVKKILPPDRVDKYLAGVTGQNSSGEE